LRNKAREKEKEEQLALDPMAMFKGKDGNGSASTLLFSPPLLTSPRISSPLFSSFTLAPSSRPPTSDVYYPTSPLSSLLLSTEQ
jgi:hypothetical protein